MTEKNSNRKDNPLLKHHYHSVVNRGIYSLSLAALVLLVGTFGMHLIEGFSYIDSFYFTSMIATGQGPPPVISPTTPLGKLFTSFLAFTSVGAMIAALGFLFGPFLGKLWKVGIIKFEEELEALHLRKDKK
jgi:hypothetical protein